ncbi:uncharacterized protein LOC144871538 [Branchiostoma floridae x Branchiostoma japonicum]
MNAVILGRGSQKEAGRAPKWLMHGSRTNMTATVTMFQCDYCSKTIDGLTFVKCNACNDAYYCCKAHQDVHWPEHEPLCLSAPIIQLQMTEDIVQQMYLNDETDCQTETATEDVSASFFCTDDDDCSDIFFGETNESSEEQTKDLTDEDDWSRIFFGESAPTSKERTKDRRLGKTARKRTSSAEIHAVLAKVCCRVNCLKRFTYDEVAKSRKAFWVDRNESEAREHMLLCFKLGDRSAEGAAHSTFHVCGKSVCYKAWMELNGISPSRYYSCLQQYKSGRLENPEHGRLGNIYPSARSVQAQVWLEALASKDGDRMPNSDHILLPASWTMNDVYVFFQEENKDEDIKPLKRTQFFNVWRTYCRHIRIPKFSRFAKCTICDNLKKSLQEAGSKREREEVRKARSSHILLQKLQRLKYYKHSKKARRSPGQYMSVIIDGMDQDATLLPHYAQTTKDDHGLWRLKTQVTGALSHGEKKCYARVDHMQYPHDTNLTLNFLTDILVEAAKDRNGHLPPVLYVQMDNKAGECKNRWILAYCCLLVHLNVVRKVKISYLMVGHTHEDIDQLFSKIQSQLKKRNATTMDGLLQVIEQSYTPQPKAAEIDQQQMYDIKEWLDTAMLYMEHHNYPHAFKIERQDEVVTMLYKMWSSDKEWLKPTTKPGITHQVPLMEIPSGQPGPLEPIPYLQQTRLKATINKLADVGKLTPEEKAWWTTYTATISTPKAPENTTQQPWKLLQLGHYNATDNAEPDMDLQPLQLTINTMLDKHHKQPEVYIGSKETWLKRKRTMEKTTAAQKKKKNGTEATRGRASGGAGSATRGRASGGAGSATRGRASGGAGSATRGRASGGAGSATRGRASGGAGSATRGRASGGAGSATRGRASGGAGSAARGRASGGAGSAARGRASGGAGSAARGRASGGAGSAARGRASGGAGSAARGRASGGAGSATRGRASGGAGAAANGCTA